MNYSNLKNYINSKEFESSLNVITYCDDISIEKERYLCLLEKAYEKFGDGDYHFISSPGRCELVGNHTDHQFGHVVACTINIDNVVIFKKNSSRTCNYHDDKYGKIVVDIDNLDKDSNEENTSISLIKGIAKRLKEMNYIVDGFDAYCDSKVLVGSGMSSSACFEIMITEIFNVLFNENRISRIEKAVIGQYAENFYFGKSSGLMDQLTISNGNIVFIDFSKIHNPKIETIDFDFNTYGYDVVLVNTKSSHENISNEYSKITEEMKLISNYLDVDYLSESSWEEIIKKINDIKENVKNDRALLRSLNYFDEDRRAIKFKEFAMNKDLNNILRVINESGKSSFQYLQNIYLNNSPLNQPMSIALYLIDSYLDNSGAFRIHGGGFAGTILVVVPMNITRRFVEFISSIYGENSTIQVKNRKSGTQIIV